MDVTLILLALISLVIAGYMSWRVLGQSKTIATQRKAIRSQAILIDSMRQYIAEQQAAKREIERMLGKFPAPAAAIAKIQRLEQIICHLRGAIHSRMN